jgi:hypothetical protein
MVPSFDVVSSKHERGDSNADTHNLGKYASNLEPCRYLWLDLPPDLYTATMTIEV